MLHYLHSGNMLVNWQVLKKRVRKRSSPLKNSLAMTTKSTDFPLIGGQVFYRAFNLWNLEGMKDHPEEVKVYILWELYYQLSDWLISDKVRMIWY